MNRKNLADPESACKPVQPGQAAASERAPGALERFAKLAGGGPVLMTTARFGRSPVRNAAYRLRARRPDFHLKPSWHLFASLAPSCCTLRASWGLSWQRRANAGLRPPPVPKCQPATFRSRQLSEALIERLLPFLADLDCVRPMDALGRAWFPPICRSTPSGPARDGMLRLTATKSRDTLCNGSRGWLRPSRPGPRSI
jgi:hypothetical protein